jgi:Lysyl oxidase
MAFPHWPPRPSRWLATGAAAGAVLAATLAAGPAMASARTGPAGPAGPEIRLIAAQKSIRVPRYGSHVFIDPGIYLAAYGSPLEFEVRRAGYSAPVTISQVIRLPGGGTTLRPLPAWVLRGWSGLRRFFRMTITNSHGRTVGSKVVPFCPNSPDPQRTTPSSPPVSVFPQSCYSSNPFEQAMVWGLQRGWATDPFASSVIVVAGVPAARTPVRAARGSAREAPSFRLRTGRYTVTLAITTLWQRLLHVRARDASATVTMTVTRGSGCTDICPPVAPAGTRSGTVLPGLPAVPTMTNPPASVLPDLIPLPSWGISVQNKHSGRSYLSFGATVWIGGHSRLDVEGFRSGGSPVMQAYQYFWRGGKVVGRAPAGTMGFDGKKGHHHWHFEQFAQYRLLGADKSVAVRSRKVGFCIAPTDAIDLLLPRAVWQPSQTGLAGQCGSPSALWVQEMLPLGWGDTYVQDIAGQSFDISKLPNGTYYIEVVANPEKVLRETDDANDISLRKVILGGRPGHRTVRVPAFDGIDPER